MTVRSPARFRRYALFAPAAAAALAVSVYPIVNAIRVSLERSSGFTSVFVGLENYAYLLRDGQFWDALRVTLIYSISSCAVELVLGTSLAVAMMNAGAFARFIRILLILPMVLAPIVVGIIWRLMYASQIGAIPYLASLIGARDLAPLSDPGTALLSLIVVDVWQWTPFMFLIVLAGLQGVPDEPLEAAQIDGASKARTFWSIILPMIRPIIGVAILLRIVDAFTTFDQVFVLTRGGPGTSTQLLSILTYNTAFKFSQAGYASAMTLVGMLVLVVIVATLAIVIRRDRRSLS